MIPGVGREEGKDRAVWLGCLLLVEVVGGGGSFDFYSAANLTANLWATGSLPGGLGFIICEAASDGTGAKQEMRN